MDILQFPRPQGHPARPAAEPNDDQEPDTVPFPTAPRDVAAPPSPATPQVAAVVAVTATATPLFVDKEGIRKLFSGRPPSQRTLARWRAKGLLPAPVKIAGRPFWPLEDLKAWAEHGCPIGEHWAKIKAGKKRK